MTYKKVFGKGNEMFFVFVFVERLNIFVETLKKIFNFVLCMIYLK